MGNSIPADYPQFLVEIKSRIRQARYQALRAVNAELLELYSLLSG